ncbi:MAG TPA: ferrochelatase [Longimicrobiales bacterium]
MTGIILLNFGEPEDATLEEVTAFLERIFAANMSLEGELAPAAARARIRRLAEERAPGLIAEYEAIGGSPLNRQAREQGDALVTELRRRGHEVRSYVGHQFTEPLIATAVRRAREDGVERLIGLPVYPLCGPSTTIAALAELRRALDALAWDVPLAEVGGWHGHPLYAQLRADGILETARAAGLELTDPRVRLVFSVHGTPLKYIEEGSRYVSYAEASCAAVAAAAGVADYEVGYQNHTNRPVAWTQPDIEAVIERIDAEHVIVVPISFMHEQSETLAELDHELREAAEARGLGFHRVPVPHADPRVAEVLADVVEPLVAEAVERRPAAGPALLRLPRACRCRPGAVCMSGHG